MSGQISASELYAGMAAGTVPEILDLRNEDEVAAAPLDGPGAVPIRQLALWHVLDDLDGQAAATGQGAVVVCAHGNGSAMIVEEFADRGRAVRSLAGGMVAWSELVVCRPLPLPLAPAAGPLRAWQFLRPAKGCLSYLVGVPGEGCLVIDPGRHLDPYLQLCESQRMRVLHVVDTHLHADHISGGPRLAQAVGARYSLPEQDADHLPWPSQPLRDGQRISLGSQAEAEVMGLHLPGHTPGTTAVLVRDVLVAAGDTVFVRGVGRPDLTGRAEELAQALYVSVRDRLATLAPGTALLPAHWSSWPELGADGTVRATVGEVLERDLLAGLDVEAFVAQVLDSLPSAPASYARIRAINAGALADRAEEDLLEIGRNQGAAAGTVRP